MGDKAAIALDARERGLLDRPSVDSGRCAVCGMAAGDRHHVIPKRMGGRSRELERRIPTVLLCGWGNTGGCHGLAHDHVLHFGWDDARGGWVHWISPRPMGDFEAWEGHSDEYRPLPGWEEMLREMR